MKRWESLVDQKIREAMEQGEFDNLAGAGQPIDLSENPYEDPDWRTAHRMLRNAGFAPAWIEERKDIEAGAADLMDWLHRYQSGHSTDRQMAELLNQIESVDGWNLQAPAAGFQRNRIDVNREIDRIKD